MQTTVTSIWREAPTQGPTPIGRGVAGSGALLLWVGIEGGPLCVYSRVVGILLHRVLGRVVVYRYRHLEGQRQVSGNRSL